MFLQELAHSLMYDIHQIQYYLPYLLAGFAILWAINIVNWFILGSRLNILGIYPRHIFGLPGIVLAPLLHGNFNHLFFNSIPAFLLICFILLSGVNVFCVVTAFIVLGSGALTWLFGRRAIHIGMSGLIAGYFSFLLLNAYSHPTVISIGLAVVALYYFGGILFSLIPTSEKVSWEGHLFGFVCGLAANFWYLTLLHYYFLFYYRFFA